MGMFDLFLGSFLNAIIDPVRYIYCSRIYSTPTNLLILCMCLLTLTYTVHYYFNCDIIVRNSAVLAAAS